MSTQRWIVSSTAMALTVAWGALAMCQDRPRAIKRPVLPAQPASPAQFSLTDSEVQAFVTEVVPHIERIMGRRFKSLPPLVVNDEEAVARVFAGDLEATFRKANPQIPEAELSAAVLAEAYRKLPEILGKYGLKVGKLALMPSHLGATMTQFHIHRKHGPGIMRLLIAHELTHALQAQYVDVQALLTRSATEDATGACTAVIEGQAMFVQDRVADALKLNAAAEQYNKIFSPDHVAAGDADSRDQAVYQEFIYLTGKRFVEHFYEKGGADRLWEILAYPPRMTSMISRPETYNPTLPKRPELGKVFVSLAAEFSGKQWTSEEHDLGEIHVRAIHAAAERPAVDRFTEAVVATRTLSAQSEQGGEVQAIVFVMQEGKAAVQAVEFLSASVAQDLKAQREDSEVRVKESSETKVSDVPCDASRSHTLVLADANDQQILDKRVLLVARGPVVLQLTTADYTIPKEKLGKLVDGVLRATEQAAVAGK